MRVERLANESEGYRQRRRELLEAEIALRNQRKKVAELRRQLPLDTRVENYAFQEIPSSADASSPIAFVRLAELFVDGNKPLVIYHFMYGGAQTAPCPMCSMWTDGYNAVARHLRQHMNFALVAEASPDMLCELAQERGWNQLRFLSSKGSRFKTDLQMQTHDGKQLPGVSVFTLGSDGSVRHFYTGEAQLGEDTWGGLDFLTPVWNILDLTPEGRGSWMPRLVYDT